MKKYFLTILIFVSFIGVSQTTYIMNNSNVALTCPSTSLFYDSGNSGGNYGNSENFTKTFSVPAGSCLMVTIANINIESCCDRLRIFDGPNGASPLIGSFAGVSAGPFTYISSGSSMTFSFTSDGSVVNSGWTATITCQAACTGTPNGGTIAVSTATAACPFAGPVTLVVGGGASTGCGITAQWQSAPSPTGPWTNLVGGNTTYISTSYAGTTYFRKIVTCGANSAISNTISVGSGGSNSCSLSNYSAAAIAYAPDVFVGTATPSTDDVLYNNIAMFGFNFCYTGATYWGGYIASNTSFVFNAVPCFPNIQAATYAAAGVGTGWSMAAGSPAPVNGTSIPRNAVLGPWHDANPSLGGTIAYTTLGVAPNRRFVVKFQSIPMFSCGTSSPSIYFTGQIKLFEGTNAIEIHIGNKGICPGWNSGHAVMGLHSFDGTTYIPPVNMTAHNVPTQWTMVNQAYRFTAPCANGTGPCAILPIFFKNFYGERVEGVNKLTFETSVEENVNTFIVERSSDASTFMEIGRVKPRNVPSEYKFDDIYAKAGTINYYRITSVENDGKRNSTFVYPLGDNESPVTVSGIFPNPVQTEFAMSLDSKLQTTVEIKVYDVLGNVVKVFNKNVTVGMQQLQFNLSDLATGTYMLEVSNSNKEVIQQQKLIKVD